MNGLDRRDHVNGDQRDDPLLIARDISVHFPSSRGDIRAVDGVTVDIRRGETLGLVGESGSGKSVLARAMMRLLPSNAKTEGTVIFDGRDITNLPNRQIRQVWGTQMARISQDPMTSLNPVVRIERQMTEAGRKYRGFDRAAARKRAIELLAQVGIPEPEARLRAYPHELSGGMRQRVSIATALFREPQLLVADEPTTALDVTIQRQILDLLSRLQRAREMSMLLVTHNLAVAAGRCDRIAVMYGGRIAEIGPARQIFSSMMHPYTAGLLEAMPRLEGHDSDRMPVIPGLPTTVINPGPGCRFAARCQRARARCQVEMPELESHGSAEHQAACFYPLHVSDASSPPVDACEPTSADTPVAVSSLRGPEG